MTRRAFLGLGSNLGDRARHLRDAVDTLRAVDLRAVSPVYETEPVGGPGGQGAYLNLVAELDTDRSPHDLLGVCHRLEAAAGRVRDERWGPRTLDVDVLWIDGVTMDDPDLQVPHPRMWERRFVLAPLRDLAPDLVDDAAVEAASGRVEPVGALDGLEG
jgi:2-amino-4-hydroxy-6-hydroxymethyldihydropteridine diphosphokinase